jgi:transposase
MKTSNESKFNMYVGMDVDKEYIDIAVGEEGRDSEVRHFGRIHHEYSAIEKFARKYISQGYKLHFCYEAGPTGYELYRYLRTRGYECDVIAPSLIPRKSGDRVKTNRRDAINLARQHRAGDLTRIYVPQREDEAIRDMVRGREDAKQAETRARQHLLALLLRNGVKYSGKTNWTAAHKRWLGTIKMGTAAQQIVFQEYKEAIDEAVERVSRMTKQLQEQVEGWRLRPVVEGLQAMRGVSFIVAVTLIAELGDLSRFRNPEQIMSYLGLVPSEHSTGNKRRPGSITKSGNGHARTALVEAAWAYHLPARVSKEIEKRQEKLSKEVRAIAWKAQIRLCGRYRKLVNRGKNRQVVITAIARELAGFVWAIAKEINLSLSSTNKTIAQS